MRRLMALSTSAAHLGPAWLHGRPHAHTDARRQAAPMRDGHIAAGQHGQRARRADRHQHRSREPHRRRARALGTRQSRSRRARPSPHHRVTRRTRAAGGRRDAKPPRRPAHALPVGARRRRSRPVHRPVRDPDQPPARRRRARAATRGRPPAALPSRTKAAPMTADARRPRPRRFTIRATPLVLRTVNVPMRLSAAPTPLLKRPTLAHPTEHRTGRHDRHRSAMSAAAERPARGEDGGPARTRIAARASASTRAQLITPGQAPDPRAPTNDASRGLMGAPGPAAPRGLVVARHRFARYGSRAWSHPRRRPRDTFARQPWRRVTESAR